MFVGVVSFASRGVRSAVASSIDKARADWHRQQFPKHTPCLFTTADIRKESKTHHTTKFCVCTLALKKCALVRVDVAGANE